MFQKTECVLSTKDNVGRALYMCYLLEHGDYLFAIYWRERASRIGLFIKTKHESMIIMVWWEKWHVFFKNIYASIGNHDATEKSQLLLRNFV